MTLLDSKPNIILTDLFRQMVIVNIVINLIQPCNQLIDTILTGQAYGAMALQVYALFLPVNAFLIAASCLFSKGTQITCSHLMGRGRISEAERVIATAVCMGLAFPVLVMILVFLFPGQLSVILGASYDVEGQIGAMSGYLMAYALGIPAIFLMDILMCLLQLEGRRKVLICGSACVLLTNALGDLANIFIFKLGIRGMALATSLSNIIVCVFILIYYVKKAKMLHLSLKNMSTDHVWDIIKNGAPGLTYYGSLVIRTVIMNALILSGLDRGALVSLLVVNNFATVTDVMIGGWGDAVLLLGGVLYGEKDKKGADALLKLSSFSGALTMGLVTALSIIFAVPVSQLFINAQDASYIQLAARAVSIAAFYLVPDILQCITKKYIQAIGCSLYTSVTNFLTNVIYCCGSAWILIRIMGADGLFLSYTICYVLAMISNIVFLMIVSKKKYEISEDAYLTFNIRSLNGCTKASENAYSYFKNKGMKRRDCFLISLYIEEMTKNIVVHGFDGSGKNSIVVKIIRSAQATTISIKDNCMLFDPTIYYKKVREDGNTESGLGIRMIMSLSKKVIYTSNFNLNNVLVEV